MRGASTTPREGLIVDHFRLEHELGRGATGLVFSAQDLRLERRVAIKFLDPALALEPDYRRRFVREARTAAKLHHPNVATVFEAGETESRLYLVMELVEGETLGARVERVGALSIGEAVDIGRQIAAGLSAAHDRNLLHRDLKPDNVVVSESGRVAVLDFGIAKQLDSTASKVTTTAGRIVGTPGYIAPEQLSGDPLDARSDLFSFGCVLFEVLAGRPAFEGSTPLAVLIAQGQDEVPPLTALRVDVPAPLAELVEACLRRDREARPASARAVEAALAALELEGHAMAPPLAPTIAPVGPRTVPSIPSRQTPLVGSRRRARGALILGLALAAAGGWLVARTGAEGEAGPREVQLPESMLAWELDAVLKFAGTGQRYLRTQKHRVLVADLAGATLADWRPPAGTLIQDTLWSPDGEWLAITLVGTDDGSVRAVRLDLGSGRVRDLLPSGYVLAIDPAGERLLVSTSGELAVIDLSGRRLSVGPDGTFGCASWGPGPDQLVVGAVDAKGLYWLHSVDPRTGGRARLPVGPVNQTLGACAVAGLPEGRLAFAQRSQDDATASVLRVFDPRAGGVPGAIATFPSSSVYELRFVEEDDALYMMRIRHAMEVRLGDLELEHDPPAISRVNAFAALSHDRVMGWSGDGSRLLALRASDGIRALDVRARSWTTPEWVPKRGVLSDPVAVDAARYLAWSIARTASTATVAMARLQLFEAGRPPRPGPPQLAHQISFRAGGQPGPNKVAVACDAGGAPPRCWIADARGEHVVLHRYDPDTNQLIERREVRDLVVPTSYLEPPCLTVRGARPQLALVFHQQIYLGDEDGPGLEVLPLSPIRPVQFLDWIPDRDALIVSILAQESYLSVVDLDGTERRLEPRVSGWVCCPKVSGDGRRVAFSQMVGSMGVVRVPAP